MLCLVWHQVEAGISVCAAHAMVMQQKPQRLVGIQLRRHLRPRAVAEILVLQVPVQLPSLGSVLLTPCSRWWRNNTLVARLCMAMRSPRPIAMLTRRPCPPLTSVQFSPAASVQDGSRSDEVMVVAFEDSLVIEQALPLASATRAPNGLREL
jgi:hypothetical protein